jgi:hypothetical protein
VLLWSRVFGAGRGFFTMRHKVQDVGPALKQIYHQLDAHAVQELITYLPKPSPYCLLIAVFCCHAPCAFSRCIKLVHGLAACVVRRALGVSCVEALGHQTFERTFARVQDLWPGRYHVDVLAFHWLTALACLDKCGVHDRLRVSEVSLVDPMNTFFSYGLLRAPNQKEQERFRPRALFGIRSNLVSDRNVVADKAATVCLGCAVLRFLCSGPLNYSVEVAHRFVLGPRSL